MTEVITNSLRLKATDFKKALTLFEESLNMEVDLIAPNSAVVSQNGEALIYLSQEPISAKSDGVQLLTSDCIALYCLLKSKGIAFTQAPSYTNEGMIAEFTDASNNQFLLIEPRNYND